MKTNSYVDYILDEVQKILSIDSPTGFTKDAAAYVCQAYEELGYQPELTVKGGVLVDLGPAQSKQSENPKTDGKEQVQDGKSQLPDEKALQQETSKQGALLLEAHIDTLGAMVATVKENGRLRLTPLGGMNPNNGETENCHVITRSGKRYEGTFQLDNASIHVNGDFDDAKRSYDGMEVVLDEDVRCKADTEGLGIQVGDIVAFEPRTRITESGYIKSRFLDDKLSVGILLGLAKWMKEEQITPSRRIYQHITVYEEVGHGACGTVPKDVDEILSVDMGCVGEGLTCTEKQVSICAKDSRGPYNYDVVGALIEAARKAGADYAVDVYPHYGSDADAALTAGYDVKHGLIGAGVYASHGYERSHVEGVENTLKLLQTYIQ